MSKKIATTGQLRELLADAIVQIKSGEMALDQAQALYKASKSISDSLYLETKIAVFNHNLGKEPHRMGDLPIGEIGK